MVENYYSPSNTACHKKQVSIKFFARGDLKF